MPPKTATQPVSPQFPTVAVHVTSNDSDLQSMVGKLGRSLYDRLTRPLNLRNEAYDEGSPLPDARIGSGTGLPVFAGASPRQVELAGAQSHVILVLGDVESDIGEAWKHHPSNPAIKPLAVKPDEPLDVLVLRALIAVAQALGPTNDLPALYLSTARDSEPAADVVKHIQRLHDSAPTPVFRNVVVNSTSIAQRRALDGVFMLIHDDYYSNDQSCLVDLLAAKSRGLPLIEVMTLERGASRSSSALGNLPTVVWSERSAQECIERALCEWLKACAFMAQAEVVRELARLPDCVALSRPPEVIDVSGERLDHEASDLILHPDPELTVSERRLLTTVNPRLQFLTPTTAYRFLQRDQQLSLGASSFTRTRRTPLDGQRVGMSLSNSSDEALAVGVDRHHVDDAITFVARSIISAGGGIAYGGDSRRNGFKHMLTNLVLAYGQRAPTRPEQLHSYQDVFLEPDSPPGIVCHSMREKQSGRLDACISLNDVGHSDEARVFASCDTRRVMAADLDAAVLIGGKERPKINGARGYSGLFPGLLEEAWRMLVADKPVYAVGGFGGVTHYIGQLINEQKTADVFSEERWRREAEETVDEFVQRLDALRNNAWREKLGLPASMDAMAAQVLVQAKAKLASDDSALEWNGLTIEENRQLFRSTNPAVVAGLILKGLTTLETHDAGDKLRVELVNGDILAAERLDVLSVSAVRGVPMTGASHRVNQRVDGRLANAVQSGATLLGVHKDDVPTDWLHVVPLDLTSQGGNSMLQLETGVDDLIAQSKRSGFERVGVVLFGGTLLSDVKKVIATMLEKLGALAASATVFWYEKDPDRFKVIQDCLVEHYDDTVDLSVMIGKPVLASVDPQAVAILVDYDDGKEMLTTRVLPPGGTSLAPSIKTKLTPEQVSELSKGVPINGDHRPRYYPYKDIASRGHKIAQHLFGKKNAEAMCQGLSGKTVQLAHDRAAASIPFELMCSSSGEAVIKSSKFNRRLIVPHGTPETLFAAPLAKSKPTALLVIDPRKDLPGAREEGAKIRTLLEQMTELIVLPGDEATREAVLANLPKADFFHYCGHGFFLTDNRKHCGLSLADKDLTLEQLVTLTKVPRIAIMNACEVGRLVDHKRRLIEKTDESEVAALAEFFMHAGTQAFVGAHWALGDLSGARFSEELYTRLFQGETLAEAVYHARRVLLANKAQWGNYMLYGQADIRLCHPG